MRAKKNIQPSKTGVSRGIAHFSIVRIMKTFSPAELEEFDKFIRSPFYNNHSTVVTLYKELKKSYPDFSDKSVTKEKLFSAVKQDRRYDDKMFRKYLSRLNQLAEEYLKIMHSRVDPFTSELNILNEYSSRNLAGLYGRKLKVLENLVSSGGQIDGRKFLYGHLLGVVKFNHKSRTDHPEPSYQELADTYFYLHQYFTLFACIVQNQNKVDTYSFNEIEKSETLTSFLSGFNIDEFIKGSQKLLRPTDTLKHLFFELAKLDLMLNENGEQACDAYYKQKKLILENIDNLSSSMQAYYLQRLNVFCVLQNAKGKRDMNRELFENYKLQFERGLFAKEKTGDLNLLNFRSIIKAAVRVREFDWAADFIESQISHCREEIKSNLYHYCQAMICLEQEKYDNALEHISKLKSPSLAIVIDSYVMKSKIFLMQGYYSSAVSVADTFRHYISGSKLLSDYHKLTLKNFLKYYRQLLKLIRKGDKKRLSLLLDELRDALDTREKKWMIRVIEDRCK